MNPEQQRESPKSLKRLSQYLQKPKTNADNLRLCAKIAADPTLKLSYQCELASLESQKFFSQLKNDDQKTAHLTERISIIRGVHGGLPEYSDAAFRRGMAMVAVLEQDRLKSAILEEENLLYRARMRAKLNSLEEFGDKMKTDSEKLSGNK
ncbi:hypothetical protein [Rosistilla oblonga]|uniref:hypothetical protein n=1 Tax=Rosistilla oblonga TaxID=2527990 RepID=UPI003A97EF66